MRHIDLMNKPNQILAYILEYFDKHSEARLKKIDDNREQNIAILQQRYGYSKEKAEFELDTRYSKAILGKIRT